jgi:hypothetical protein
MAGSKQEEGSLHPYAIDTDEHRNVLVILIAGSILAAWLLTKELTIAGIAIPWWVDAPSVLGFFGIFYKAFDKGIWHLRILRPIKLVKTPNLQGRWKGSVTSSYDSYKTKHDVAVEIRQTWTRIMITLTTTTSTSHSLTASITTQESNQTLTYEYLNEPKPTAEDGMHTHRGTAILTLVDKEKKLEGQYYSGRDRQNHGTLLLRRSTRA